MKKIFYKTPGSMWPVVLLISAFILSIFASCEKHVTEDYNIDYGLDYYPLEVGKYKVYMVDSVIYDPTNTGTFIDTVSVFIKEEVVDTFYDSGNALNYVLERSQKYVPGDPWTISDRWYALRDSQKVILTEENQRFVKLTFPVKQYNTWDGNSFIDPGLIVDIRGESIEMFKNWYYEVTELIDNETIGSIDFSNIAHITAADDENLIEKRYVIEKYARGIGLIYKELKILDTQNINPALSWEEKAEKGFILRQYLIEYN